MEVNEKMSKKLKDTVMYLETEVSEIGSVIRPTSVPPMKIFIAQANVLNIIHDYQLTDSDIKHAYYQFLREINS